ncbi:ABC transporter substrate-binding protein [Shewanella profunda]|uniref:ABC transporter substrate-binding protein n=1 Tax=Shewanella profunda TaxID=254793 RepID=UPI00200CDEA8|nr:ABC transporter substrate-binding protein [Shewanella profunda]MCL1090818.1 ABC transporter substrate-binding protein [Shewanella profunda]
MKRFLAVFYLCLAALSSTAAASPVMVNVVTSTWEGYANPDETGYYFDILQRVFPASEWQLNVEFMPFARTLYLIEHQRADMALSVYPGDIKQSLLSDNAVEVDSIDAAVTPQIAANWVGIESLSHRKVQAMLAYRYNMLTPVPMYYEESSNMLSMLNSLNAGRIDAVLDYQKDILALVPRLKSPQNFNIIQGVIKAEAYFAFADTDKGIMLKQHFDREHKRLIDSGEQERLYLETIDKLKANNY